MPPEGSIVREMPIQVREAAFVPATYNEKDRSIELVWTTGARVLRYDWFRDRQYYEELSLDPAHVDLTRLNSGAALLDSHQRWSIQGQIGVIERAWLTAKEGLSLVRFSKRDEVAPVIADVKDGIIRNVSCGYIVRKYEVIQEQGQIDIYRAIDWQPTEISLVSVPADAGAGVRNAPKGTTHPCEMVNRAAPAAHNPEVNVTEKTQTAGNSSAETATTEQRANPAVAASPAPAAAATTNTAEAEAQARAAVAKEERVRIAEVGSIARVAGLDETFVRTHVDAGTAIDRVRVLAFEEMAKRSKEGGEIANRIQVGAGGDDTVRERALGAVLNRVNPGAFKLEEGSREFRGLTLLELGRDLLERRGIRTRGMSRMELATAALGMDQNRAGPGYQGTSDLANVLANVMNKSLRRAYESAPRTFTRWARQSTNPDFKQISRTMLSGAPTLLKIDASGEFKRGSVSDGKETYQLATYGRTVAFTRQALINDDLNALQRMPELFGRSAADLESDTVYGVLTANAALSDAVALFHADHDNLSGAGAPTIATLSDGRGKMRAQVGLEGRELNLAPAYLILPANYEQVGYQYTSAQFVPAKSSDVNEFRQGGRTSLEPVVEVRLDKTSTTQWYLSADPNQIDTVEYCYLEGNEGVYTETRVGFDIDGIELKARHDFAAKALDFRGLFRNG